MESTETLLTDFRSELAKMVGLPCVKVAGVVGVGSMITILLGKPFTRVLRFKGGREFSFTDADVAILPQHAAWRIDAPHGIACSSTSSNDPGGHLESGATALEGRRVVSVLLSGGALDLSVEFEGGYWFRIFCDQTNEVDLFHNYHFRAADKIYVVECSSRLSVECGSGAT